jgi:hypothetical protein
MKRIIYLCERDYLEEEIKIECFGKLWFLLFTMEN